MPYRLVDNVQVWSDTSTADDVYKVIEENWPITQSKIVVITGFLAVTVNGACSRLLERKKIVSVGVRGYIPSNKISHFTPKAGDKIPLQGSTFNVNSEPALNTNSEPSLKQDSKPGLNASPKSALNAVHEWLPPILVNYPELEAVVEGNSVVIRTRR